MPNIEDLINKAIQDGHFDDLPGKGKPLRLDDNPLADPEWRLAHHMIKSSGYTLPWIGLRQEILDGRTTARETLARAWSWRQSALGAARLQAGRIENQIAIDQVEAEWQRALAQFTAQVGALNKKITDYNLVAPSDRFQLFPINLENEVGSIIGPGQS